MLLLFKCMLSTNTLFLIITNIYISKTYLIIFQYVLYSKITKNILQSGLSVENCLDVYELALLHRCFDLADNALRIAAKNFNDLIEKETFLSSNLETVLNLLKQDYLNVPSEAIVLRVRKNN